MNHKQIKNYGDFTDELLAAGFAMGGGNSEGIFSVIPWKWDEQPPYETPVRWHTGDAETDPWEWRIRVLDERQDIAYAKFFFKKSGYMTKEWAPYFLSVRRGNTSLAQAYADGDISNDAKRIYGVVLEHEILPLHVIKQLAGFDKDEKSKFDRALIELQMKMFLTMCGRQQKISQKGEEYGWSSTVFCTTESFWGADVFNAAAKITQPDAILQIMNQVRRLNPEVKEAKAMKFIKG